MISFIWSPAHLDLADRHTWPTVPEIRRSDVPPLVVGYDVWDHWPVLEEDGSPAVLAGGLLVIALTAPIVGDPEARHALARLRLLHRSHGGWCDLGNLFPDGFSPGSREWAGSAIVDPAHRRLTVHFTAAGTRGEPVVTFRQRMFETSAELSVANSVSVGPWSPPVETVIADGILYETEMAGGGAVGTIKAFRDPYFFRDPADGQAYLLFAASRPRSGSEWNGLVGIARHVGNQWQLLPPIVDATGLNNELERPHIVVVDGRYYLLWSTQRKVFAPHGPSGPNGLYGLVAESLAGPWQPINGSGIVLANPASAPFQAYSWQLLSDLSVWSFADMIETGVKPCDAIDARHHFAGTVAPVLRLVVEGDRAWLA